MHVSGGDSAVESSAPPHYPATGQTDVVIPGPSFANDCAHFVPSPLRQVLDPDESIQLQRWEGAGTGDIASMGVLCTQGSTSAAALGPGLPLLANAFAWAGTQERRGWPYRHWAGERPAWFGMLRSSRSKASQSILP